MANYNFYISTEECKEHTNEALRGSWKQSASITAIFMLIMLVLILTTVLLSVFVFWWLSIPLGIFSLLVAGILSYGYNIFCLNLAQGKTARLTDLFAGFGKKMGAVIKLTIKKLFLYIFWLVALIVPFFVKTVGYSMSTLLLIDNPNINSSNALKESKHLMKQNYGRYVKFVLSFAGWFLLGIISAGIGFIWIAPMFVTNKAMFYENLKTDF